MTRFTTPKESSVVLTPGMFLSRGGVDYRVIGSDNIVSGGSGQFALLDRKTNRIRSITIGARSVEWVSAQEMADFLTHNGFSYHR